MDPHKSLSKRDKQILDTTLLLWQGLPSTIRVFDYRSGAVQYRIELSIHGEGFGTPKEARGAFIEALVGLGIEHVV